MIVFRNKRVLANGAQWLSATTADAKLSVRNAASDGAFVNSSINADIGDARPYHEVPRQSKFELMRSFMRGGEFYDASMLDYVKAMRARYGNIFIMPGLFGKPDMVYTTSREDIENVFRNEGMWPIREGFDSVVYYRKHIRPDIYGETLGFLAVQGEDWGKLRTTINPILMQPRNIKMYYAPLSRINDEFIERIKTIRDPHTLEVPADFEEELSRLIFESISLIALNREMGIISRNRDNLDALKLFRTSRDIFRLVFQLDIQPSIWKWVATPAYKEMIKALQDSVEVTQKFVAETKQLVEERKRKNEDFANISVLEKLIEVNPKMATVMAMDILFAGVDATSVALSAVLLCLSKNPEKQRKLREEVLKIMPTKDTPLDEQSMKDMPYLRAVIKETLRYYPNGVGTFRTAIQDLTLSGYRIPQGTRVVVASNVFLKDESHFPRSNEFLPERWLRDEATTKKSNVSPFTYLPFGFGPRVCIGRRIVDLELETTLTKLIRNFNVEFNYDASKPYKSFFTMVPIIPLKFKFSDIPN